MKICWDNLERVKFSKEGNFRIGKGENTYIEMESCNGCGEPYLTRKCDQSEFCTHSCAVSGKPLTKETRKKMSTTHTGKTHSIETKEKISKSTSGSLNPNYKGGVDKLGLASYDGYKDTLSFYEEIRKQDGTEILEVKCTYCGRWYAPTYRSVKSRLEAINNLDKGEGRLYCSENCKQSCPTYRRRTYPKGFKHASSREVDPCLRKMVLERDNWTCQICGKTVNEAQLHVHHMDPAIQNPMFQNDMDSCITLCKKCHKMVHKQHGCRYIDLRCKKNNAELIRRNLLWPVVGVVNVGQQENRIKKIMI